MVYYTLLTTSELDPYSLVPYPENAFFLDLTSSKIDNTVIFNDIRFDYIILYEKY